MKKMLSVILTAVMLLSLLSGMTASFAAEPEPVMYWSFEDTTIDELKESTGNAFYTGGTVEIVAGGYNGSGHALKIKNADSGNGQWVNDLKPDTTYTVTFWVKLANQAEGTSPNVGVSDNDASACVTEQNFTANWAQYSLTFKTGFDSTQAKVYTWVFGSGNVDFYLDEVILKESVEATAPGTLTAWDFESGNLAGLQADPAYYQSGNVSIVPGGANGTDYALLIKNADSGNGQWINDLKPDTNYTVTFWVKLANRAEGTWPNVGVSDYDGSAYITEQNFTESWAQYSLSFKTGADVTSAKFYTWVFGEGNVDFYLDEVVLKETAEAPAPGTLTAWDFESGSLAGLQADPAYYQSGEVSIVPGGANGTSYALLIKNANSGNGQWINGLKPDTNYTVTFWVKLANRAEGSWPNVGVSDYDGSAYIAEQNFTEDWAQYSLSFKTGTDVTSAKFYTWIFGEGKVDFYLDEVVLTETAEVPAPGTLAAWDFESGSLAGLQADPAYYQSGNVSIVTGGANGTNYALLIKNANSGNGQWINGLKPNTKYEITYWAKVENCDENTYPNAGVNEYDGSQYVAEQAFSNEWGKYSLTFTTGKESTQAKFYTWIFGEGKADFYIDEVTITEKPADTEPTKPCDGGKDCPSYAFTDVKASDWYHTAVDFAVERGLFNGMTKTTFEPNTPMTRAMLVTVLWRYEGSPEEGKNTFTDVPADSWYTKAVAWASANGIVGGVGNNKFDPNGNITREQLAAILFRYSGSKGYNTSARGDFSGFPAKNAVSAWATDAYGWAVGEKLITGNDGKLDPQGNATRAQVATILMRFINASIDPNLDGTLSVLMVGNSYTVDTMEYVYHIAKSAGVKNVVLGILYFGGSTIEQHYGFWANSLASYEFIYINDGSWITMKNAKWTDGLDFYDWDYIGFQQSSHLANDKESFRHLGDLISMAKKRCPNAKVLYNMTWCRPMSYTAGSELPHFPEIVQTAYEITNDYGIAYVTTPGTAIENIRSSYIDKELLYRDDVHLSYGIGRYTAGLAFFTQLTGISIEKIAYKPGSVSEEYKVLAIEAAMNAAKNSKEVTPSQYPTKT